MCTVSYIPRENGYILTSNRDEDPRRETKGPEEIRLSDGLKVIAPQDKLKGGTWIAMDRRGRAVCLLNGAFGRHKRQLPYRRSRGYYVFESLQARDFDSFARESSLDGIEPFTLLMITRERILKMIWDGNRKYHWVLPSHTMHLWSSPTLYTARQHGDKELYFKEETPNQQISPEKLLRIHGSDTVTPFILNRPEVSTVSITQLIISGDTATLQYLVKGKNHEKASFISSAII